MKSMKNIFVLGTFGYGISGLDGQTIKTQCVFDLIKNNYKGTVRKTDTLKVKRRPWLIFVLLWNLLRCNTLVIIPARNSLSYVFPICYYLSKLFNYKIVLVCIGGWQYEYFMGNDRNNKPRTHIMTLCRNINCFMPELIQVEKDLKEKLGFKNTAVLPNFRHFGIQPSQIITDNKKICLVFLARINKMKGYQTIFDAIPVWKKDGIDFKVDFYGIIEAEDREDFEEKINSNSDSVRYMGAIQPDEVCLALSNYDVMLFPTKYYTEGFPGSILDAFIAGIPVIVTEWKHSHEFVTDGSNGFIIPFNDGQLLFEKRVEELYYDRGKLERMKHSAKLEASKYTDINAWKIISKYL